MIRLVSLLLLPCLALFGFAEASAQEAAELAETVAVQTEGSSQILRTALLLTLLAVLPAIFISTTSFVRIVVVLAMVRHAFGMPETPPNPVLISLALFLSMFVMAPTVTAINEQSVQPFLSGEIEADAALEAGSIPLRNFMLSQVTDDSIATMYGIAGEELPERPEDVSMVMLTPAFILNELKVAFTIGFIVLLPFLLIDLIVSSVLLSLGMMMVPPATISLPIKILLFVVIDGWALVIEGVLGGFG